MAIEPPPFVKKAEQQPQQIITEVTAMSNVNFIKPKAYKPFEYDNPCDPQKLTLRQPNDCAILFVEDLEVSIRAVLQMVHTRYENAFFKVAVTASKALEAFKRNAYDLVIMDIGLPDNKDLEMALEMRQLEKQFGRKPAPICILSGHFGEENYRKVCPPELQDSLIQRFYTKPMVSLSMRDVISRYLPNAVLRKELVLEAS
jgi:CheY-like chemotaxis protein